MQKTPCEKQESSLGSGVQRKPTARPVATGAKPTKAKPSWFSGTYKEWKKTEDYKTAAYAYDLAWRNSSDFAKAANKRNYARHAEARRAAANRFRSAHREELNERSKLHHRKNAAANNVRHRTRCLDLKLLVFSNYCPNGEIACACCGESWPIFLAIDHIDGRGDEHRKVVGSGIYNWLKKNNYPPGFQVLCHNCNFAKHVKKICPHQSTNGR